MRCEFMECSNKTIVKLSASLNFMVVTRGMEETKKVFPLLPTTLIRAMSNFLDAHTFENINLYFLRKRWRVLAYSNYSYLSRHRANSISKPFINLGLHFNTCASPQQKYQHFLLQIIFLTQNYFSLVLPKRRLHSTKKLGAGSR